jgi:hypothetical protein
MSNISKEHMLKRCEALVIALVGQELSKRWWQGNNKSFGITPEEMFALDPERVYHYLMQHYEGTW